MGRVLDMVRKDGRDAAIACGMPRAAVEAASGYLSDEVSGLTTCYSGLCQIYLPHKRLDDDADWIRDTNAFKIMIAPGRKFGQDGGSVRVGVPYGSRARMIMLYVQTEAVRTNQRRVELGGSLRAWLTRMGISVGGTSVREVMEQAERLTLCHISLESSAGKYTGLLNANLFEGALFANEGATRLLDHATLSQRFYDAVCKHPVPLLDQAIRQIQNNSVGLDVYLWLAYRLHVLKEPTPISWSSLAYQFGAGYSRLDNFRRDFLETLELVSSVYPDARVDVVARSEGVSSLPKGGLMLHPSRPPVAPRQLRLGSL